MSPLKIQKRFVFVPIDEAANTIAIICKHFYVDATLKEVGINGEENKTYIRSKERKCEIIEKNIEYSKKLGFKMSAKEKDLPLMYWLPKMRKNRCGTRFINPCNA